MKLYLMRHGDAENRSKTGKDFDRDLSTKGRSQVRNTNSFLGIIAKDITFTVYCSGAKRTRETWKVLSEGLAVNELYFEDAIYHSNQKDLYAFLRGIEPTAEHVLLIGHNNAISYFASDLIGEHLIFPTSGLLEVSFPIIEEWKHIGRETGVVSRRSFN